jgi:hypothetical protein
MKPTRGKVTLSGGKYIDSPDGWIAEVTSWPTSPVKQVPEGSEKHKANGLLFVAAWNAAQEINAENPIAAAEVMPEIFRLLQVMLDQIADDPGAVVFFDLGVIKQAQEVIAKAQAKE